MVILRSPTTALVSLARRSIVIFPGKEHVAAGKICIQEASPISSLLSSVTAEVAASWINCSSSVSLTDLNLSNTEFFFAFLQVFDVS